MCIRDRVSTQSTGAFSTAIGSPAGAWVLVLFSCMPLSDPLNDLLTEVFTLMDEQGREGTKLVDLPQWISVHRRWCDEMGHSFDEDATRASFALHDLDEDGSLDLQEWLQAADKCLTHNDTDQPSGFTLQMRWFVTGKICPTPLDLERELPPASIGQKTLRVSLVKSTREGCCCGF
eukprot:TRINITY_DN11872_c0_g1_i1.p1 TRINITY_DN11872_c0_g1~~TRINITY_DN11872_c0_g1_i1.p1  ORF type:complete len:176 (+),score=25.56 TRINITY_DN11872_c0_g1_i1:158-685(+)